MKILGTMTLFCYNDKTAPVLINKFVLNIVKSQQRLVSVSEFTIKHFHMATHFQSKTKVVAIT